MTRIVIEKSRHESKYEWWNVTSLYQLGHGDGDLTPHGTNLVKSLDSIMGLLRLGIDDLFTVKLRPVHEALRPWSEIEPEVVTAFAGMFGVDPAEVDVVRPDDGKPNRC